MQKKLIALAVVGLVAAPAFAQSNVTIYGVVDVGVATGNFGSGTVNRLTNSGYTTERLGFQGSEDLGGGMKANFRLEMGQGTDNGTNDSTVGQFFQRESRLGLSGSFGSLDAGRQYSPIFNLQAANDQFRVAGVGSNYSLTSSGMTRVSNSIRWESPNMSGFGMTFLYGMGDVGAPTLQESTVDPKDQGRHTGFNLRYSNGPLSVGYAYANQKGTAVAPAVPAATKANLFMGSYDMKVAKLYAGWETYKRDNTTLADTRVYNFGVGVPVGADEVKASYTNKHLKNVASSDSKLFAVGYVHPMSKRTTLYGTWAKMTNDSKAASSLLGAPGTVADYDPSSLQVGVSHNF